MAATRAAEQLIAYFEQGITRYVVNKEVPDGLNAIYQQLAYKLAFVARHIIGKSATVNTVSCCFYGTLKPFAKWFVAPVCAALSDNFTSQQSADEAEAMLKDNGIALEIIDGDDAKKYGDSMTIDLCGRGSHVSLRGTITENNLTISRINDYDKIYLVPQGNLFLIDYLDRPGVLAVVTKALAEAQINIDDIHAPHDREGVYSISIVMTDKPVPETVAKQLKQEINARFAVAISF